MTISRTKRSELVYKALMPDLKHTRVLVTPTSYARHDPTLRTELEAAVGEVIYNETGRPLTSGEVRALLPGIHGYIAGLDVIDAAALDAADSLQIIARYGVGVERIDLAAAQARGIIVTNTPAANASAVAELAIGLMLALARSIPQADSHMKRGDWPRLSGTSLEEKTVGLLGFGAIGRMMATRLRAFGRELLAYDPFVPDEVMLTQSVTPATIPDLLAASHFVSLHLPVTETTRHMVDTAFLARMQRGAFLVNTARGELVDETALLAALESGHLGGAALDAFEVEPPPTESTLIKHPRLIATPHIGATTDGATTRMGWMALRECLAVLAGEGARYRVT